MTRDEFLSVRRWMIDRWPPLGSLTNGQWIAYRDQLERFDEGTVMTALRLCVESGADFPPGVAKLSKLASDLLLRSAQVRALPEPQGVSWAEYSRQRWGKVIPLSEIVSGVEP